MITIQKFVFNPFSENTYVVFNEEKKAVIIDPGMYYEEEEKAVDNFIVSNGLKLEAIWHTHSHLDHMFGTGYVSRKYNLDPIIYEKDLDTYQNFERVESSQSFEDASGSASASADRTTLSQEASRSGEGGSRGHE